MPRVTIVCGVRCISSLLLAGADKNAQDCNNGETPLLLAVEGNHLATVEKLLAAGARIDLRPRRDNLDVRGAQLGVASCLERAALLGHVGALEAPLRHGSKAAGYGATGDNNATALHFAAAFEGPDDNGSAVCALLNAGADVEAVLTASANGSTPLHIAANRQIGSSGTILALLEGRANVDACDVSDRTGLGVVAAGWCCVVPTPPRCIFRRTVGLATTRRWVGMPERKDDTTKVVRPRANPVGDADGSRRGRKSGNGRMAEFARLVSQLVGIETECVFRLVVEYL